MENQSAYNKGPQIERQRPSRQRFNGRPMGGLVIVIVGTFLLLRQLDVPFPHWLFSPWTFLIALGVFIGVRHQFRGIGWLIPIIIGSVFIADDLIYDFHIHRLFWPILIIALGMYMILRPKKKETFWEPTDSSEPLLDVVSVFGGVKKNIITKDFKGGEVTSVFGGSEINLTQADINGRAVLEITAVFGGSKLIVPANWQINSEELVAVLGALDDKRTFVSNATYDPNKVLVIKGTVVFGGIEIKSY